MPDSDPGLTVVSWNLQGRVPHDVGLPLAFSAWQPDVALLQEADGDALSRALGPDYRTQLWWPAAGGRPGIALVSRLPVRDQGSMGVADPPGTPQRASWAILDALDGAPLTVASVHLGSPVEGWPPSARRRRDAQRAAVAAWAAERIAAGERIIVGGDFNTIDPMLPGMVDATQASGPTWRLLALRRAPPLLRIDAVFVAGGILPRSARVERGHWVSDHFPLVVELDVA